MVLILKKKAILLFFLCFFIFVILLLYLKIMPVTSPKHVYSIVIDAGHGGIDGGCVGVSGVKESDLNLKYAQKLKELCQNAGFRVVMTRETEEGLYSPFAQNKKRSEMEKREKIINESNTDLFVSIHMNSMTNKSLKGAQVFYRQENNQGKAFAESITKSLTKEEVEIRGGCKTGDYYVLNCHQKAGVLIECGFLSNEQEEKLLRDEDYKNKFCAGVLNGIILFLKM